MSWSSVAAIARVRGALALRLLLAVAQLVALFRFATPKGLPLDDAWIHQVVARTFAESGTLGYAPGEHGAAATSYLWAALLAVNFRLFHMSPVTWAFLVNVVASLGTGQALFALLSRTRDADERGASGIPPLIAFGATLLACTSANILWFAHSGMEATMFVALSVTAIWATTDPRGSLRLAAIGGIASGLLALTRPEAAPLCALLLAHVIVRRKESPRFLARAAAVAVPAGLAGLLYVGSNLAKTGHATPTTLSGRRWLWFSPTDGLSTLDRLSDFVDAWVERLSSYTFDTGPTATWILLAVAAYGAVRLARSKNDGARLVLVWAAIHTGSYVFLLPTPGHGGRYQPFVPLLYTACLALGVFYVVGDLARTWSRAKGWVPTAVSSAAILALVALGTVASAQLGRAHVLAVAHIEATEIATGRFVDQLPREGVVASFDIGGIGWATRRPILDAGGLSDPATASLMAEGRIWEYLKRKDVRWLVLPEGWERVLPVIDDFVARLHLDNPAVRLTAVHEEQTSFALWAPAIGATWNAAPKQVVYRIDYTGEDGPRAVPLPPPGVRRVVRDDEGLVPTRERQLAERSLGVLEAWGVPLAVQLTRAAPAPTPSSATDACAVTLGAWGVEIAGCDAVAPAPVLRSMLHEHLGRYLDIADVRGALREVPHVVAMAKRLRDPRFHPPMAAVPMPETRPRPRTVAWGVPLTAVGLVLLVGLELVLQRQRRRRPDDREEGPPSAKRGAASAMAAMVVIGAAGLALCLPGCTGPDSELLRASTQGAGSVELALARGAKVDARDGAGRSALMLAAGAGDVVSVSLLLGRGAQASAEDTDGATALHHAARAGQHACTLLLARAGAPLDRTAGPRKRTALHEATLSASPRTVRALLSVGSHPQEADANGETALHLVARTDPARSEGLAEQLLAAGADPGATDTRGFTPLHAGAFADHLPLLRELVADPRTASIIPKETPSGEAAVETALRYRRDSAADLLLRHGATLRAGGGAVPPLHDAARMDSVDRVATLLAAGADPAMSFEGAHALDVARRHGSKRVELLLVPRTSAP